MQRTLSIIHKSKCLRSAEISLAPQQTLVSCVQDRKLLQAKVAETYRYRLLTPTVGEAREESRLSALVLASSLLLPKIIISWWQVGIPELAAT